MLRNKPKIYKQNMAWVRIGYLCPIHLETFTALCGTQHEEGTDFSHLWLLTIEINNLS